MSVVTETDQITPNDEQAEVCVLSCGRVDFKPLYKDLQSALYASVSLVSYPELQSRLQQQVFPDILLLCEQDEQINIDDLIVQLEALYTGVVVLVEQDLPQSQLKYLSLGADACAQWPVNLSFIKVLVERLYVRIKQIKALDHLINETKRVWVLNEHNWVLKSPGSKEVSLTATEFKALYALMRSNDKRPVAREVISAILGRENCENNDKYINTLMSRMRRKIVERTGSELNIKAYRCEGYLLTSKIKLI